MHLKTEEQETTFTPAEKYLKIYFENNNTITSVEDRLKEFQYQGEHIFNIIHTAVGINVKTADNPSAPLTQIIKSPMSQKSKSYTWETFETYCSVSESDQHKICRYAGLGGSCVGYLEGKEFGKFRIGDAGSLFELSYAHLKP